MFDGEVRPPSGAAADTLDVTVRYADASFETRYILLKDGTMWKWEHDGSAYGTLVVIVLGPVAGLALGVVVVVVLWARAGLRSQQRRIERGKSPDAAV